MNPDMSAHGWCPCITAQLALHQMCLWQAPKEPPAIVSPHNGHIYCHVWVRALTRHLLCTPACVQMIHETHYLLFAVAFTHIIYTCATLYLSLFRVGVKRFCLCAASAEQWVSCLPKRLSSPHCRCQQDHRPWCRSSSSRTAPSLAHDSTECPTSN
jgi:hypothetical protein